MKHYLIAFAALTLSMSINAQDTYQATETTKSITWPDLKNSYLKTGDFVSISALKSVGAGQSYEQVRLAIGNPHFSEGLGHPNEFNYAFNFYTNTAKTEWVTCQYQVTFNKDHRVDGRDWRDQTCEQYLESKKVPEAHPLTLSADGMFAFDKSGFNDLQPTGQQRLRDLVGQLNSGYKNLREVNIVGHTDRFGSNEYNAALSVARANTVKRFLVVNGIPAHIIRTSGMGEAQPVVECAGAESPAVVACLLPNRRIEITVSGEK